MYFTPETLGIVGACFGGALFLFTLLAYLVADKRGEQRGRLAGQPFPLIGAGPAGYREGMKDGFRAAGLLHRQTLGTPGRN